MNYSLALGVDVLRRTPSVLGAMLSGLSDDWISGDEGPDTWSPYQVLGQRLR